MSVTEFEETKSSRKELAAELGELTIVITALTNELQPKVNNLNKYRQRANELATQIEELDK